MLPIMENKTLSQKFKTILITFDIYDPGDTRWDMKSKLLFTPTRQGNSGSKQYCLVDLTLVCSF